MNILTAHKGNTSTKAWWALLGAVFLYLLAGTSTVIGDFSEEVKRDLGIDQDTLTATVSFGFIAYLVPLSGVVIDRFGLRACISSAGVMMFTGFLLVYLSTRGITTKSPAFVGVFYGLAMQGQYWFLVCGAELITMNFPSRMGAAAGTIECIFGLGAALWTCINAGYLGHDLPGVPIFLVMACASAGCAVFATIVGNRAPTYTSRNRVFYYLGGVMICLMIILLVSAFEKSASRLVYSVLVTVFLFLLCAGPFVSLTGGEEAVSGSVNEDVDVMQELSIAGAFGNLDFWLAMWSICIPMAIVYSVTQQIGQVVLASQDSRRFYASDMDAFYHDVQDKTNSVEIVGSVCAGVSALIGGQLADYYLHVIPRPVWVGGSSILMVIGSGVFMPLSLTSVYAGFSCYMFAFSVIWAVFPGIITELFGRNNSAIFFGGFCMVFSLVQVLTGYLLAVRIYNHHAKEADGGVCYGKDCYFITFVVYLVLTVTSSITGLWLAGRTRKYYCGANENLTELQKRA